MRVISNWDAEKAGIKVEVIETKAQGTIVGHNGKSMKYGRLYNIKLDNGTFVELKGSDIKRLSE